MKKPRLFFLILIMLVTTLTLTSCNNIITTNSFTESSEAKDEMKQIYKYLKNQKTKELKNLFCEKADWLNDLNTEIEGAYEFFDGEIVSHGDIDPYSEGESWRHFKMTRYSTSVEILEAETDAGTEYVIQAGIYTVNEEHPEKVGVTFIAIRNWSAYESAVELYGEDEVDPNDDEYRYLIGVNSVE